MAKMVKMVKRTREAQYELLMSIFEDHLKKFYDDLHQVIRSHQDVMRFHNGRFTVELVQCEDGSTTINPMS